MVGAGARLMATAAELLSLDPAVWGPGAVLVALFLSGIIVTGQQLKSEQDRTRLEREERLRLQEIVERALPALEKAAEVTARALEILNRRDGR